MTSGSGPAPSGLSQRRGGGHLELVPPPAAGASYAAEGIDKTTPNIGARSDGSKPPSQFFHGWSIT
ncbi:UNVERIFIED_CONTAM: hypothetical protein Sradi_5221400 [Sesamum radiatum]|uniref:Uncharacterized protein n=1 Tax=Sesamum radiatum TaxID=300843 RepID=A0AAW2LMC5_SESRA